MVKLRVNDPFSMSPGSIEQKAGPPTPEDQENLLALRHQVSAAERSARGARLPVRATRATQNIPPTFAYAAPFPEQIKRAMSKRPGVPSKSRKQCDNQTQMHNWTAQTGKGKKIEWKDEVSPPLIT